MTGDLESLQGTWDVVDLETDGQKVHASLLDGARIVLRGNRFTSLGMGATYEGTFAVDATATPSRLDLLFDAGPEQGSTNLGIYELDGDTWTICLATGGARPTRFTTEPGSGCALETLRRAADAADVAGPAAAAAAAEAAAQPEAQPSPSVPAPPTELEGEWTMVSGMLDGRPLDRRMLAAGRRVTRGDESKVLFSSQLFMRMRFTIDPTRVPRAIDYVNLQGTHAGKAQQGIYELEGETLTLCIAPPGAARPADFTTTPGDGRLMTVWTLAGR